MRVRYVALLHMTGRNALSWLLPALLAAIAFYPALPAGITPEDWGWLALTRHLDDPTAAFRENAFFTYFYRPVGIVFWWLTAQIFGADGWWHGVASLLLHAANAALVAALANTLTSTREAPRPWLPGLVAGLLFACQPSGIGTAIWLSDRFDPLALLFGLAALLAGERALRRGGGAVLLALLLLPALISKEVAYAIAAALYLRVLLHAWNEHVRRYDLAIAISAAVAAALLLRIASETSTQASGAQISLSAFTEGALAWWRCLPHALFGFNSNARGAQIAVVMACGALLVAPVVSGLRSRNRQTLPCLATGLVLLIAPSILQAPIVREALASDAGLLPMNLRFYYLAAAGVALLGAAAWMHYRALLPRLLLLALPGILLVPTGFFLSRDVAGAWTRAYAADSARVTRLGHALAQQQFPPGCRLELAMPDYSDDVQTHIDLMVKAMAPRGSSLLGCVVFAQRPVFVHLVAERYCSAEAWPGLRIAVANGLDLSDRFGNLCTLQFTAPDQSQNAPNTFRFSVDAQGGIAVGAATP